jgi:hypothetical protein
VYTWWSNRNPHRPFGKLPPGGWWGFIIDDAMEGPMIVKADRGWGEGGNLLKVVIYNWLTLIF